MTLKEKSWTVLQFSDQYITMVTNTLEMAIKLGNLSVIISDNFISKIQEKPTKKIIYLREFLENFPSISNNDKDIIINSLKDEKNKDKLREKMSSLVSIFL